MKLVLIFATTLIGSGLILFPIVEIEGHGMMLQPIYRGAMWRYPQYDEYNFEENLLDREAHCGGFIDQHWFNEGKCGPCGDNWSDQVPRKYENTGPYGKALITGNYTMGQNILIEIYIEAAHGGYFEFRICQPNSPTSIETNECFGGQDKLFIQETHAYRYDMGWDSGTIYLHVQLPTTLTCDRCVLQWEYVTGNTWGECEDGSEGLGCGPQETFRNCADISIQV